MSRVNHLSSLSLLAVLVLAGCSSQAPQPLKKGEKAIDVASVVRQKMPASVKDRDAWAKDLATTFESQGLAPTLENVCSVLAVAQQESNYQADPAVPGLSKIAWQEIDRRAERMHIPAFLVHTALKIKSPNGKSYSERLDSVRTEKQLSAIFDDLINMVPMGQTLFGSLNPVRTGGPMQVSIAFAEQHTKGYPWKMDGTVRQEVFSRRGGLWFGTYHLLNYPASYSAPIYRFADFNAGWYASRNAAFQNAVSKVSGVKLALDGDLIRYDSKEPGKTELATRKHDKQIGWNIREFGPLPIPKKGQTVMMNRTNCLLYRQLIGWEQKKKLRIKDGQIVLGDSVITQYRFKKNYYFVSGDNMANSQDSRYWGMLPEEYIVGKAARVWYSEDKFTEKPRWDRIMKKIK